jgi:hypothetical protein
MMSEIASDKTTHTVPRPLASLGGQAASLGHAAPQNNAPTAASVMHAALVMTFGPLLLLFLFLAMIAIAELLGTYFEPSYSASRIERGFSIEGEWLAPALACSIFYLATIFFFERRPTRVTVAQAIAARALTAIMWIPIAIMSFKLTGDQGFIIPMTLCVAACALAATGPSAQLIGTLLLISGTIQALLAWGAFWPLLLLLLYNDQTGLRIEFDGARLEYLSTLKVGIYALATIPIALAIGLRRPFPRYLIAIACVIGLLVLSYNIGLLPIRFSNYWITMQVNNRLTWEGGSIRYLFIWDVTFFLAFIFVLFAPEHMRVWSKPPSFAVTPVEPPTLVVPTIANDENWHQALLASLKLTGIQRTRGGVIGRMMLAMTGLLIVLIIPYLFRFLPKPDETRYPEFDFIFWYIEVAVTFVVLGRAERTLRRYMSQLRARSAEAEIQSERARRPVFYLRSFSIELWDRPTLPDFLFGRSTTDEERIASVLRRCGAVIAIGRPGERLPRLGAARFYVSDDLWTQKVADVACVSQLVVWTTGTTEGLRWEISHLLETIGLDKLVLWAHPHLLRLRRAERELEWDRFRKALGPLFPKPLPLRLGDARAFYFDPGGNVVAESPPRDLWSLLLRPLRGQQAAVFLQILRAKGLGSVRRPSKS